MRVIVTILVLLGVAGGAAFYAKYAGTAATAHFRTTAIRRGDLLATVGATGTVEPEEVVDVGAQVMGLILEFGADPHDPTKLVDYGTVVEKGTVLARIDPTSYEAAFEQAEAALERAKADLLQLQARYRQAEENWKRAERMQAANSRLRQGDERLVVISGADYDADKAAFEAAKANVAVGEATIKQNLAALRMARTNLGYTTIKSPVRGVIIDRRVNIGQTVVASLNAPSLFLIAKDLRRMQVWASVNEADLGRVHVGMPVRFTIDAYPGEIFRGTVTQIRLNATMTQNIVTYTVVVTTDNANGRLLPYQTANVQFEVAERSNVLLVPNAALRWQPQPAQIDPALRDAVPPAAASSDAEEQGRLWIPVGDGLVRPLDVVVGVSDGKMTACHSPDLKEGIAVVVGEEGQEGDEDAEAGGDNTKNPFLPKVPKGSRPPPGPM